MKRSVKTMKNKPNGNFTLQPNSNNTKSATPRHNGSQKPAKPSSPKPNPNYVPPASTKK